MSQRLLPFFAGGVLLISVGISVGVGGAGLAQTPPSLTALIVGHVVDGTSGSPVTGAVVSLTPAQAAPPPTPGNPNAIDWSKVAQRAVVDANGGFVFAGLPPGVYNITSMKPGYLDGQYGARMPAAAGARLELADGQRAIDVAIRMWRAASISGTVVDEANEPSVGVTVELRRRSFSLGRQKLVRVNNSPVTTDDRGVFRFSPVVPGDYVISVPAVQMTLPAAVVDENLANPGANQELRLLATNSLSAPGSRDNQRIGDLRVQTATGLGAAPEPPDLSDTLAVYQTTFFPAATSIADAGIVTVRSGEARGGLAIRMRARPAVRVSGTVTGPNGPVPLVTMLLSPQVADDLGYFADFAAATSMTDARGRFTFLGVPAGAYVIRGLKQPLPQQPPPGATSGPPPVPDTPTLWATEPISVGATDLDVPLAVRTGLRVFGRFEFEGQKERPTPDRLQLVPVVFESANGVLPSGRSGRADANGAFSTAGVEPGKYFVRIGGSPPGWRYKSSTIGGQDVTDKALELRASDITDLVITFTDTPLNEIRGSVRNARGEAEVEVTVVVFPADPEAWVDYGINPPRLRSAKPSSTGAYALTIMDGDYFLAAGPGRSHRRRAAGAMGCEAARGAQQSRHPRARDRGTEGVARSSAGGDAMTRGIVLFLLCAIAPAISQVRDAGAPPAPARMPTGTASISGVVTDDQGQPMRRARVMAQSSDRTVGQTATTDDRGRFSIKTLPAGRYNVQASKRAWLDANYGATRPGRAGTPVALADTQQLTGLRIAMTRGAVIAGAVRGDNGEPMRNIAVTLLRYSTLLGVRSVGVAGSAMLTDDLGAYRFWGLSGGDYIVMVSAVSGAPASIAASGEIRQTLPGDVERALSDARSGVASTAGGGASRRGPSVSYASVFYPGTTDVSVAETLHIAAAEERANVDVLFRLTPTVKVEGTIVPPGGVTPVDYQLRMFPLGDEFNGVGNLAMNARPDRDGRFMIPNVAPGRYTIQAGVAGGPPAGGGPNSPPRQLAGFATADVVVFDQDVNVDVRTAPPGSLKVRIVFDGADPPKDVTGFRVMIVNPFERGNLLSAFPTGPSDPLSLMFPPLPPGKYTVTWSMPRGSTWYAVSAMTGGRDAFDAPLDVRGAVDDLVVTFTDHPSEIAGRLEEPSGRPATDYFVIVFPADRSQWTPTTRRIQSVRPGNDGAFTLKGLPSGDYLVNALTDVEPGEWFQPPFLEQVARGAQKITVTAGQKTTVGLRISGGGIPR